MKPPLAVLFFACPAATIAAVRNQLMREYELRDKPAQTSDELRTAMNGAVWDLLFCTTESPDSLDGLLAEWMALRNQMLIFILCDAASEASAFAALRTTADDVFRMDDLGRLLPATARMLRWHNNAGKVERTLQETELHFTELFEHTSDAVIIFAARHAGDWVCETMNPACEQTTGIRATDCVGRSADEFLPTKAAGLLMAGFRACRDGKHVLRHEHHFDLSSGRRWFNTVLVPLSDTANRIRRIVCIARDVTERRLTLESLRDSESRFRGFFELSLVGAAMTDRDHRWLEVNDRLCIMLGVTRKELAGQLWTERLHRDDRASHLHQFSRIVDRHTDGYTLDARFIRKNGSIIHTAMNVGCVRDENGDVDHFLLVLSDITERTNAEDAVRKLNAELEHRVAQRTSQLAAANRELEAFCYSVSHDLRAPLRSIDGFSQALLEDFNDRLNAEGQDYLRRVRAASQRMGELIDALLQLSRVARAGIHKTRVDLSAIARHIAEALTSAHPERQVDWQIETELFAQGDRNLLTILMENLLGNAFKYTGGKEHAHIEFGRSRDGGAAHYFVKDDGAGFDMTYADKLFQPFQRLHHASEFEGHGIGLATVQRIASRHGGRAWATGELDKGATFCFELDDSGR